MKDTSTLKILDSSFIIENGNEHIILIQDLKKEKEKGWFENPFMISLFIPVLVAALVAWITNILNKKKNKIEIDKLKEETAQLKKSFQPIVISTLQSIQDKIVPSKIDSLKQLVQIKNEFVYHEQQYCEGDPIVPDFDEYLNLLFYNFSYSKYEHFNDFHDNFSYLFPDNVFLILQELKYSFISMNETKKSFESMGDPDLEPSKRDREEIEKIVKLFDEAILAIRKDCHLDTSFIHDFIEQNK